MSTRVILTVQNPFSIPVTCVDIRCETFENLSVGTVIPAGGSGVYQSETNDRLFCTWSNSEGGYWQMAMTCPKASDNGACGCTPTAGLQKYEENGTPANFTFILGQPNQADWDSGSENNGDVITYGDCS